MAETAAPKIAMVALDLDDTLLTSELVIPQRTKNAIRAAWERGIVVTVATGRMFRSALPYALDLGIDVPIITYNGALIRSAQTGRDLYRSGVPRDLAREIVAFCDSRGHSLNVYLNDNLYVARRTAEVDFYESISNLRAEEVGDLSRLLEAKDGEEPPKLLVVASPEECERLRETLSAQYEGRLNVTRSSPRFLEITCQGVHKGEAVARLAGELNIPLSAVMAVGDSLNDIEMFRVAGWAVAVSHSPEVVRREADYVTTEPSGYAVAEAFERFVL
jgi:Cof subfamily protein (haloacid dehalogenase superfamily)